MDTIQVSKLRANLMKVIKEIKQGSTINITSRGKVVAKLVPPGNNRERVKNKLKEISKSAVLKDIISPIEADWEVLDNDNR
jgi:prevent-host-death family protein